MEKNKLIARIDNQLVMKAHYSLSTNEQKLILFLVSKIDNPEEGDFYTQKVKIKELEKFFISEGKRSGSIYKRVDAMCKSITGNTITIPKGFVINGAPLRMHQYISWFSEIRPYQNENGEMCLMFQFSKSLKDFLLKLSEYVRIGIGEVMPMKGKYSIRMYQIFKAQIDRNKKFRDEVELVYDLEDLRGILGIEEGKYKRIDHFKDRVLNPIIEEVNRCSQNMEIGYELEKSKRVVVGVKFLVKNIENKTPQIGDYVPSVMDLERLTRSQLFAYKFLVERKCIAGIAYKQIIQKMPSSEYFGWEDVFIEKAWKRFEKATTHKDANHKAGAFVKWWMSGEFKDKLFPELMEEVVAVKKSKKQVELDNREWAKGMSNGAFLEFLKGNKN